MTKTLKVGSTGRYGPRYGKRTKRVVAAIEKEQKKKQVCPYCERPTLKRLASGIWTCRKCGVKFAGAAYFPKSTINVSIESEKKEDAKSAIKVSKESEKKEGA